MNRPTLKTPLAAAALALVLPFAASASLVGDTVDITAEHGFGAIPGGTCQSYAASGVAVGAGPELTLADLVSGSCFGVVGVDIDPLTDQILIEGIEGVPNSSGGANFEWIQVVISDMDWLPVPGAITGVELLSQALFTDQNEDPAPVLSWTADSITILWDPAGTDQVSILEDGTALFSFSTTHDVAAPGALSLLVAGLALLGARRRRQRPAAG